MVEPSKEFRNQLLNTQSVAAQAGGKRRKKSKKAVACVPAKKSS